MQTLYSILWALMLAGFFAIEIPGVINKKPGDTLTDHVRHLFRFAPLKFAAAGFWVWLTIHFWIPSAGL